MKYTYLLIDFFTILIPFIRSFEPRIGFYRKWNNYLPATIITAIFFLVWDYYKTKAGVWSFNDNYILGVKVAGLPLEEILFFITVPYACTFIYETLKYYLAGKLTGPYIKKALLSIALIFFILSFFAWGRAYTWSVLFIAALWMPFLVRQFTDEQSNLFILSYLVSILPMLVVNGLLTALPIVIYNNAENTGLRIGTIPVEDFLYCFILLGMNIGLYEWFQRRKLV